MLVTLTIPDNAAVRLATILRARGVAGADDATVIQNFFIAQAQDEVRAARLQAAQEALATEQAKGVGADPVTLKDLLYAEYQLRVS